MNFEYGSLVRFIKPQFPWEIGDIVRIGNKIESLPVEYQLLEHIEVKHAFERPFNPAFVVVGSYIELYIPPTLEELKEKKEKEIIEQIQKMWKKQRYYKEILNGN